MAKLQEMTLPGGNRALLLIALAAGLVAAILVVVVLSNSDDNSSSPAAGGTVPALVAAQGISPGTEITEDMVKVVDVPEDLRVSGAYAASEPVIGEVSKIAISQGEQITSNKIGIPVPDEGLQGVVPKGMRGVGVEVDEVTAVGGNLLPGDRVDVIMTQRVRTPGLAEGEYVLRTVTILQNVEVLSVAQEKQEPSAGQSPDAGEEGAVGASSTSGKIPDDPEEQPDAQTLTLALSPADALSVILAQEHAIRVWAVVRAFGDDEIVEIEPRDVLIVDDDESAFSDLFSGN